VLFCVLFVCKCVLPPGDNPIAVNKYIKTCQFVYSFVTKVSFVYFVTKLCCQFVYFVTKLCCQFVYFVTKVLRTLSGPALDRPHNQALSKDGDIFRRTIQHFAT
jgi:hypothetical protein